MYNLCKCMYVSKEIATDIHSQFQHRAFGANVKKSKLGSSYVYRPEPNMLAYIILRTDCNYIHKHSTYVQESFEVIFGNCNEIASD